MPTNILKSLSILAFLTMVSPTFSQHVNGYVFVAPGGATGGNTTYTTLQFGAGGDYVWSSRLGAGAEFGALGRTSGYPATVSGFVSPNGYYHFGRRKGSKPDFFVTAGYTGLFRGSWVNLFNFGTGFNYRILPRYGLRVEFRDHVYGLWSQHENLHFWGFRLGFVF
jgi:hypothetical protein